jgi:molybdenum cofactor cytidylyltransferase
MVTLANRDSVVAILLAAGSASRFGSAKQLAKWNGEALVRRANKVAMECCGTRSILVTGHEWCAVQAACAPMSGFFIINDESESGMGSSLALAVRSIQHAAAAVVVLLADQPLVGRDHVNNLISNWSGDEQEIVASSYANTTGVPALFAAGSFEKLIALTGDQGARNLLDDPMFNVRKIAFADAAIDIDTVEDLSR